MAEAFLRHAAGDRFDVQSAGTKATRVHPLAVIAMRELGIDISGQASKSVEDVGEGADPVRASIDAAYRDKYGHYGPGSVDQMVAEAAAATTLRLDPVPAG